MSDRVKVELDLVADTPQRTTTMDNEAANGLSALRSPRRDGSEAFHRTSEPLGFELRDFWAWSVSDLVSNATRGRLAEYLVARALGISTAGVRDEWSAYDLVSPTGVRIEVKSAAYLQSWFQKSASKITFSTRPSRAWDPNTNILSSEIVRQAELYVFALLRHLDKASLDPLDVNQWEFYVLPTTSLNKRVIDGHSIGLKSLQAMSRAVSFAELSSEVDTANRRAKSENR